MNNNITRFDLRHLRAFMAVAESLHFKKAAESLHMTQPALSRLIKGLEEGVGADLFERTTRQVALSRSGHLFLNECQAALSHLERGIQLAERAAQGDIGHITIAYNDFSINGVLPRILDTFKETYPDITVELIYMPSHHQHEALLEQRIDIGFMIGPVQLPGIETHRAAIENLMVVLPRRHKLADRPRLTLAELEDEKFILGTEEGWSTFRAYVFRLCLQDGFRPQIIQEASTSSGIFGLVAANMGISLYSDCINRFRREDIAVVPLASPHERLETIAAWNQAFSTPSCRLFRDLLSKELEG
ncbi:LysR family transcriptional regulator [Billgrantia diversa]|uniref:LysR family transcriptional regulator n=1 Tax=Halomonas sp. MCCC 1A13316 TaxID=2733487 RepID=UPI0018A5CF91|nr:LysR family transcriptional regulator [Halomonas sp. MCCC 1A13316]QOR37253.1 LysR family transcriptional regulator [Halomonas sp. MCCC 1A13316]